MPQLIELIKATDETPILSSHIASLTIRQIAVDSRQVTPGTLFVALKGEKADGASYVSAAKQAGAVAVLCAQDAIIPDDIPLIRVNNPRHALAKMAAAFYAKQPAHMVAVTGTDGKTSTADFFRQFWHLMGMQSASIGTLGVLSGDGSELFPGTHTTPDPMQLHHMLSGLTADYVGMEASSHGLHQHRLDGVVLEAAAFTNLTRDHLDYHKTEEAYFAAKALLFSALLPEGKTAVLNADDKRFESLVAICKKRNHQILSYGKSGKTFTISAQELLPHGQQLKLSVMQKTYTVHVPLVGAFQTMNILAALGLVVGSGGDLEEALAVVPKLRSVAGRLERVVVLPNGASVFVDYAHTPAALANILKTLRQHTQAKLHVVFGCGGDRDAGKRPQMGKAASELADSVIITDDNPRSEDPAVIREAIRIACPSARVIGDRREAIGFSLGQLQAGDILVIAGKGHEKTQIIGTRVMPFDDVDVVRQATKDLKFAV